MRGALAAAAAVLLVATIAPLIANGEIYREVPNPARGHMPREGKVRRVQVDISLTPR